jgi:hypothetical protein
MKPTPLSEHVGHKIFLEVATGHMHDGKLHHIHNGWCLIGSRYFQIKHIVSFAVVD